MHQFNKQIVVNFVVESVTYVRERERGGPQICDRGEGVGKKIVKNSMAYFMDKSHSSVYYSVGVECVVLCGCVFGHHENLYDLYSAWLNLQKVYFGYRPTSALKQ